MKSTKDAQIGYKLSRDRRATAALRSLTMRSASLYGFMTTRHQRYYATRPTVIHPGSKGLIYLLFPGVPSESDDQLSMKRTVRSYMVDCRQSIHH